MSRYGRERILTTFDDCTNISHAIGSLIVDEQYLAELETRMPWGGAVHAQQMRQAEERVKHSERNLDRWIKEIELASQERIRLKMGFNAFGGL